jgi:mannose-6-phosphate isomerase-like protein (cupin superfamily)
MWTAEVKPVEKPWGYELIWALTTDYCGKVLFIEAGHSLSLQLHRHKDESWLVQSGCAVLELGAGDDGTAISTGRRWPAEVPNEVSYGAGQRRWSVYQ